MILFPIIVGFVIILNIFIAKGKKESSYLDALIEQERAANSTRRKEIPPELFLTPDMDILPFMEYNKTDRTNYQIIQAQDSAQKKMKLTMLRLPKHMTNNEIKFEFGFPNLEDIIEYEENYNSFIQALIRWAEILIKLKNFEDAETILNESIRLKSDFSKSYTLLCDIYFAKQDKKKLNELFETVSNIHFMENNIPVKNKIFDYTASRLGSENN